MNFIFLRALIGWFLFIPIVIINAGIREKVYKPRFGELHAHQVSTLIAGILFLIVAYFTLEDSITQLVLIDLFMIGLMWLSLTVLFEFIAGHFLFKNSWKKLFADYNLLKGRVWGIFLLIELFSPVIINIIIILPK